MQDHLVEISVSPWQGYEPLSLTVRIQHRVPNAREICVVWDDGVPHRRCGLVGNEIETVIENLPAGSYALMAEVVDTEGSYYRCSADTVLVRSRG